MMADVKRKIRCAGRPVTVIVLAGGRGRRMNAEKARLHLPGGTLLERVLGQVAPLFDEVLVSVSPGQRFKIEGAGRMKAGASKKWKADHEGPAWIMERRKGPGPRFVEDEMPNLGPMAGILSGLKAAANEVCAVVACDIPDVDAPLLRKLARAAAEAEIAVPVTPAGHFEPLSAVYTKAVIPEIEKLLRAGERSLIPLFGRCRTEHIPLKETGLLRNLNTRADYEEYLQSLRSK
jgi:molybdopterin-guanine dinucleotide biosynthesis protein A